jgi:hypothetical protein
VGSTPAPVDCSYQRFDLWNVAKRRGYEAIRHRAFCWSEMGIAVKFSAARLLPGLHGRKEDIL